MEVITMIDLTLLDHDFSEKETSNQCIIADMLDDELDVEFDYEDNPICPYCGREPNSDDRHETLWGYDEGEHEVKCMVCGNYFRIITDIPAPTYSTRRFV